MNHTYRLEPDFFGVKWIGLTGRPTIPEIEGLEVINQELEGEISEGIAGIELDVDGHVVTVEAETARSRDGAAQHAKVPHDFTCRRMEKCSRKRGSECSATPRKRTNWPRHHQIMEHRLSDNGITAQWTLMQSLPE